MSSEASLCCTKIVIEFIATDLLIILFPLQLACKKSCVLKINIAHFVSLNGNQVSKTSVDLDLFKHYTQ